MEALDFLNWIQITGLFAIYDVLIFTKTSCCNKAGS